MTYSTDYKMRDNMVHADLFIPTLGLELQDHPHPHGAHHQQGQGLILEPTSREFVGMVRLVI